MGLGWLHFCTQLFVLFVVYKLHINKFFFNPKYCICIHETHGMKIRVCQCVQLIDWVLIYVSQYVSRSLNTVIKTLGRIRTSWHNGRFFLSVNDNISSLSVKYGVPQGLFWVWFYSLYILSLGHICRQSISCHFYTYNSQNFKKAEFIQWLPLQCQKKTKKQIEPNHFLELIAKTNKKNPDFLWFQTHGKTNFDTQWLSYILDII